MNLDISFYWHLFWRRLPVMMLLILICSTVGVITALKLPETWSTSARLLVEEPQIPANMVSGTVQVDPVQQLDVIQQKLLTRANMIDIANRFRVYTDIREMEPDTVVTQMRRDTRIRREIGRNQATLLTISFQARNGRIARDVVNEYVTLALQENSNFRVSRAENTLAFFQQETQRLSEEIDRQSARIAAFKSENANSLPEDQGYRLSRQNALQESLARLERELTLARNQRQDVIEIFELTGGIQTSAAPRSREEERLRAAQEELDRARLVYSDAHPRIAQLTAQVKQLQTAVAGQSPGAAEEPSSSQEAVLQASLAEIDGRIEFLEADIASAQSQLETLQEAIAQSSANGIELDTLQRDYANIQSRYDAAVANLNRAQMSERIEATAQGQRISVIENASVPQVPDGPNRLKIATLGVGMGLALAVGYFILLEILNRSVRRPAELISRFNVQPIAVVPYMESQREKLLRRGGILTATAVVIVCVPLALWYIDANYLPLEVVVQKGLSRLGIG
jgi:polysaccharide chain length determinant protein (PEP-CTERM system associated)